MFSLSTAITSLLAVASFSNALPGSMDTRSELQERALPPFYVLAGDSTTAKGGGWGDGFLNHTLKGGASGVNYGHNGATTTSFRSGGDWANVISSVNSRKAKYQVYVTIQFGHNDQKATSGVTIEQYTKNLETFGNEVRSAGGSPIFVTSLTRRTFNSSTTPPKIVGNLAQQRAITIQVAQATNSWFIDLNRASTDYCNKIGPDASHVYNLEPSDNTHLNARGGIVFGRLVSDLLVAKYPTLATWTKKNETLSALIAQGKPA